MITIEKVCVKILANSQTLFLAPSNSTIEAINKYVTEVLLEKHSPIVELINGFSVPMKIYKHMTVIIMENRYNFFSKFTSSQFLLFTFLTNIDRYFKHLSGIYIYTKYVLFAYPT